VIAVLAGKELRRLFASPLAWVMLACLQVLFAFFFLLGLQAFFETQAQMAMMQGGQTPGFTAYVVEPPFGVARILLLMVIPLLSMRLISEERRNQTLTFLMSSPLSITQIVLGKFVALAAFLGAAVALLTVMSLSLYAAGRLDHGLLIGNVIGLLAVGQLCRGRIVFVFAHHAAAHRSGRHLRGAAGALADRRRRDRPGQPAARTVDDQAL
jgi:ABC-2 type transport system permease protein